MQRRRLALLLTVAVAVVAALAAGLALAGAVRPSVKTGLVEIGTRLAYANGTGAATGMVLTQSGEVLTNNHVVRGASVIRVHVPQTGRTYGGGFSGTTSPQTSRSCS
jgi:S1-C subfamily serine protease